ncbi:MAG: sulfotransferase domain-containing protein [Erythrobacter sp.]
MGMLSSFETLPQNLTRNARKVWRDLRHRVIGVPWMNVGAQDRFLFSYPRSGNTWLRHIVRHLTTGSQVDDHHELEMSAPTIDTLEFPDRLAQMSEGMRFFKSHLPYAPYFLDGKVIYVVRDGRDVLISYFDYYRHIKNYDGSLDDFIEKATKGWMRYGTWHENVGRWIMHRDHPNMLLFKFEDMRVDGFATARQVADFAGIKASDQQIEQALEASSVEKVHSTMRSWNSASGTGFSGGASQGGRKTWRDRLTSKQNKAFVDRAGEVLEQLGYPME